MHSFTNTLTHWWWKMTCKAPTYPLGTIRDSISCSSTLELASFKILDRHTNHQAMLPHCECPFGSGIYKWQVGKCWAELDWLYLAETQLSHLPQASAALLSHCSRHNHTLWLPLIIWLVHGFTSSRSVGLLRQSRVPIVFMLSLTFTLALISPLYETLQCEGKPNHMKVEHFSAAPS